MEREIGLGFKADVQFELGEVDPYGRFPRSSMPDSPCYQKQASDSNQLRAYAESLTVQNHEVVYHMQDYL